MRLVNLTPHPITIMLTDNRDEDLILPAESVPARCKEVRWQITHLGVDDGRYVVPVNRTLFGDVTGLPEQSDWTDPNPVAYVVSRAVCDAVPERHDLYAVDETVRDEQGRIIGCRSLCRPR